MQTGIRDEVAVKSGHETQVPAASPPHRGPTRAAQLELSVRALAIPMRTRFKHASAERRVTDSVWIELRRGPHVGLGEGCPRFYVTGETTSGALAWIESIREQVENSQLDLESLRTFVRTRRAEIDEHPAAWCAVELACLDLLGRETARSVETLLGLAPLAGRFAYSAVVGHESGPRLEKILRAYLSQGFRDFKLKLSGVLEEDRGRFARLLELALEHGTPASELRLRVDANNLWGRDFDRARQFLAALAFPLFAIEEPFAARAVAALSELSVRHDVAVILDESLCTLSDLEPIRSLPGRWIGNVRVSKMGGLLRSLEIVQALRDLGCEVVVGAQVGETSVLSRAALAVATAAGDQLVAQEGAFGTILLERDMVEPIVMFGPGGILEIPPEGSQALRQGGLGVRLATAE